MTLQSSGSISFSQITNEFGLSPNNNIGAYRISQNVGSLINLPLDSGIPQSGIVSFSNFFGKQLNIVVDYFSGISNEFRQNAKTRYDNNGVVVVGGFASKPLDTSGKKIIVNINKSIGSAQGDIKTVALRTGSWSTNTKLQIDIGGSGRLYGAGGNGGKGGDGRKNESPLNNAGAGQNGTSSLGIEYNQTTVNVFSGGIIQCGGGGGGGGGSARQEDSSSDRSATGGGGGGGAGLPAGSGGSKGLGGNTDEVRSGADGQSGSLTVGGLGGAGGNNNNEAFGGAGGTGGIPLTVGGTGGNGTKDGGGQTRPGAAGGANGFSICTPNSGITFTINNSGTIIGLTTNTGVL